MILARKFTMRLVTALALLLLAASPALAQIGDDLGSEQQTQGYGRIFGWTCGVASIGAVIFVVFYLIRGSVEESRRGKKKSHMPEIVLDKVPEKKRVLYLGEKVPTWKTGNRHEATRTGLKFLAYKDETFDETYMTGVVEKVFRAVKAALEERSAKKIERMVTADCLEELQTEIKSLRKKGELHLFGKLEVTEILIVHVEAPAGKENHTFTALIGAKSKDYFQDEKSGEVLKGDKKVYVYQEFWRFRRARDRWYLERIRSSESMDRVLDAKNVLAQADLDKLTKSADPQHVREFVGK